MNETELRAHLRTKIKERFGTLAGFARHRGINGVFVSLALSGKKSVPTAWLEDFGIEKSVTYRVKDVVEE